MAASNQPSRGSWGPSVSWINMPGKRIPTTSGATDRKISSRLEKKKKEALEGSGGREEKRPQRPVGWTRLWMAAMRAIMRASKDCVLLTLTLSRIRRSQSIFWPFFWPCQKRPFESEDRSVHVRPSVRLSHQSRERARSCSTFVKKRENLKFWLFSVSKGSFPWLVCMTASQGGKGQITSARDVYFCPLLHALVH